MNCDEAQERLSDYLDRALDSATIKDVEEHLGWCRRCRAEAEQMAAGLRQVANLMTVDPPIGFTERVMARVREIEAKPSLWQRLLFPLSIKLPIHATAVVLIGIMALYLLKRVPSGEEAERAIAPAFSIAEKKKEAGISSTGQKPGEAEQRNEAGSKAASVDTQAAASKPQPKAADEMADLRARGNQLNFSQHRKEVEKKMLPASEPVGTGPGERVPATEPDPALRGSPAVASRTVSPESVVGQIHSNPDVELFARRSRASTAQHRDSLGALDKSVERDSLLRQEAAKRSAPVLPEIPLSDKPQEVWLTVTRAQYDQLKKELFAIGPIESESWRSSREKSGAFRADEQLRVKVTVLPPEP